MIVTMREARRRCPAHPTQRVPDPNAGCRAVMDGHRAIMKDDHCVTRMVYTIIQPRTLKQPFRAWARQRYAGASPEQLSPKLRRVVCRV